MTETNIKAQGVFTEIFYHKNSALRVELATLNFGPRFKIEIIPALAGNESSDTKKFDYKNSSAMYFSSVEILKIKKALENLVSGKTKKHTIDHYFQPKDSQNKTRTTLNMQGTERIKKQQNKDSEEIFDHKNIVMLSIYNSSKTGKPPAFGLSEDEVYWFINMANHISWAFSVETRKYADQKWAQQGQGQPQGKSYGNSGSYQKKSNDDPSEFNFGNTGKSSDSRMDTSDFEDVDI